MKTTYFKISLFILISGLPLVAFATTNGSSSSFNSSSSQYWSASDNAVLQATPNLTIALWAKMADISHNMRMLFKGFDSGPNQADYEIGHRASTEKFFFMLDLAGTRTEIETANTYTSNSDWNLILARYDGSTMEIWINGVKDGSGNFSDTPLISTGALTIGARTNGVGVFDEFFDGSIDDVRYWQRALSDSEIANLYAQPCTFDNGANLGGWWQFENDGVDSSSNGNNLTSVNSAGFTNDTPYTCPPPDTTPPSLTAVSISSNNASTTLAKVGDAVTLTFSASEALQTPGVTIAGHAALVATTTGNNFTASTTMLAGDAEGGVAFSVSYTDLAGNAGFVTSTSTDTSSVTFDKTPPAITVASGPADNSTSTSADITFEFSSDADANMSCVFDTATTTPCVSPFATTTTDGTHTFSITATDPAGNAATTTRTFVVAIPAPVSPASSANVTSGGGQPVGNSATAPGFQTANALLPVPPSTLAATAPAPSKINQSDTLSPVQNMPPVAKVSQTKESSKNVPAPAPEITAPQNAAAAVTSGLTLPGWTWPAGLAVILLVDLGWLYSLYKIKPAGQ